MKKALTYFHESEDVLLIDLIGAIMSGKSSQFHAYYLAKNTRLNGCYVVCVMSKPGRSGVTTAVLSLGDLVAKADGDDPGYTPAIISELVRIISLPASLKPISQKRYDVIEVAGILSAAGNTPVEVGSMEKNLALKVRAEQDLGATIEVLPLSVDALVHRYAVALNRGDQIKKLPSGLVLRLAAYCCNDEGFKYLPGFVSWLARACEVEDYSPDVSFLHYEWLLRLNAQGWAFPKEMMGSSPAYPDAFAQVSATLIHAVGLPAERTEYCDAAIDRLFGPEYELTPCKVTGRYFPRKIAA